MTEMGSASCFHIKPVEPLQDVGTAHSGYAISTVCQCTTFQNLLVKNKKQCKFVSICKYFKAT